MPLFLQSQNIGDNKKSIRLFSFLLKKVEMPDIADVFGDTAGGQRFIGFCHLYFKIATALGGFQELGRMYFDIMRDSMFAEEGRKVHYGNYSFISL